ncbi:GNAT family N-acetyltransferase [Radiobacillus sp. PE A8.2]|uniref:GNAT family N-acetyltransferase n=1 Tax=Radiobacillus sp. PE A8.2 TaxID=3380349 RepID=UPI003890DC65
MYTIRQMNSEDISYVQHVAKTSWNHTYDGIIPLEIQTNFLENAYSVKMMEKRLQQSFLYVAETDGSIVGFANFSPVKADGVAELGAIYLLPEFQGKGIGSALLEKGIYNNPEVKQIHVEVEKDNQLGLNFYYAKGFIAESEYDDFFDGHTLKTVRMVKTID